MSTSSAGCRILVISHTLQQDFDLIYHVKALTDPEAQPESSQTIPWKIVNKYYSADVHFQAREIREWVAHHAEGVPAIVFAWSNGESYRDHIIHISKELEQNELEPQVSLAVRTSHGIVVDDDDDEGVDEFLSSNGFEFIDIRDIADDSELHKSAIPSLPRILDALSTIMWPSMTQSQSLASRNSRVLDLDWTRDDSMEIGLLSADKPSSAREEMAELERWLEEDSKMRPSQEAVEDPWVTNRVKNSTTDPISASPTDVDFAHKSGFDDDFTVFVSAPSNDIARDSVNASFEDASDTERTIPLHAGVSYTSLGSVSDFGGDESAVFNDDDDDLLPSQAEIQATSARIFGSHLPPPPPPTSRTQTVTDPPAAASSLPSTAGATGNAPPNDAELASDSVLSAFDLSRVLGALEGMKAEIAGLESEEERKKAAAKVALGLVYGLERSGDGE